MPRQFPAQSFDDDIPLSPTRPMSTPSPIVRSPLGNSPEKHMNWYTQKLVIALIHVAFWAVILLFVNGLFFTFAGIGIRNSFEPATTVIKEVKPIRSIPRTR